MYVFYKCLYVRNWEKKERKNINSAISLSQNWKLTCVCVLPSLPFSFNFLLDLKKQSKGNLLGTPSSPHICRFGKIWFRFSWLNYLFKWSLKDFLFGFRILGISWRKYLKSQVGKLGKVRIMILHTHVLQALIMVPISWKIYG